MDTIREPQKDLTEPEETADEPAAAAMWRDVNEKEVGESQIPDESETGGMAAEGLRDSPWLSKKSTKIPLMPHIKKKLKFVATNVSTISPPPDLNYSPSLDNTAKSEEPTDLNVTPPIRDTAKSKEAMDPNVTSPSGGIVRPQDSNENGGMTNKNSHTDIGNGKMVRKQCAMYPSPMYVHIVFPNASSVREKIKVDSETFKICGVLKKLIRTEELVFKIGTTPITG